jgi:hypothetical protein
MTLLAVAMIELISVSMLDGRIVQVNPAQIVQLVHPRAAGNKAIVEGINCVIRLADGSYVSIVETCEAVEAKIKRK